MNKQFLTLAILLVAGSLGVYYYQTSRPVVEVFPAQRGTATFAIYGTVKVAPTLTFNVHAQTGGVLKFANRLAQATNLVGMEFKTNEPLGEVVSESLDRDYAKAEAELLAAQKRRDLGPAGASALKTQTALAARLRKLAALSNAPPSEVEQAENDLVTMRETVRQQEIEIDRSTTVARQEFDNLKERKERCKFISPMEGILNAVNAVNGEFINETTVPFVLVSKSAYLEGQVNEEDVGHVNARMKAAVKLYAYPNREFAATVTQILPTANNQRYTVLLNLDQPPDNLLPGETGEVNIICGTRANALLIPTRALLTDRIWIAHDGVVAPRTVKVGFRNLERAEILDGVRDGELVVVADQDLLRTGLRVRAVNLQP